jgi:DNA-binding MarR family transcriptional regulator
MPGPDAVDEVSGRLNEMLREVKQLHTTVMARVGQRVELPATGVLGTLSEHGELRMSALAEHLRLDLSSVSRQVAALERVGWVSRQRDPSDQRASLLTISRAGNDLLVRFRQERAAVLREVFQDWSPADLSAFAASLDRFTAGLAGHEVTPAHDTPAHDTPAQVTRSA